MKISEKNVWRKEWGNDGLQEEKVVISRSI
jgi:hypothetical protein